MSEGKTGNYGSEVPPEMAPFDAWSEWMRANMGPMTATPGASVPWLMMPGVRTGEEDAGLPEGAIRNDPLLSTLEKLWDANPIQNVLPVDWMEITRSLQTLWVREMSDPARAVERATDFNARLFGATMRSWQEATNRFWGLGTSQEEDEGRPDKRFSAPDWEQNPFYETLKESYLLASEYLLDEAEKTNGEDAPEQRRLKFHLKQFVDAMAPVNYLLTNPAALKRAFETGGASLAEGARNLLADLQEGRLSMTDANAFQPGENLAITPGKVVYRNELIELIQYEPTTEKVYETPLIFFPPWINKYYILDLQPKNSMVKYLVDEGFTVFMISWKNPDASMENIQFEDYMTKGPLAAVEVVKDITGSETVNPVGYCVGGTLLAVTLAWLAASGGEKPVHPRPVIGSPQDFSELG